MQSFPQPPSAKEEKEYLKKCKEGDWQARNQLIERNMRLVAYIAKKYQQSGVEMEDLISIGTIGLIKGVDSFREDKKIRRDVYLFDTIGSDKEGNEINLFDVLEYEEEDIADRLTRKEHIGKLEQYMEQTLTPREKEILCLRYGIQAKEQKTQREIAEIYQISRSYVSRIEKKALKKLRDRYEDE